MAKAKYAGDAATVQMALVGYEVEKEKIEKRIREIQALLGGKKLKAVSSQAVKPHAKRAMSAAARKRIADAQRKRWEEYRSKKKQQAG